MTATKKRDWMWLHLPYDILASIVAYLIDSQDYIRFSVVCKQWHSVAKSEKRNHMATRRQVPFLLIPENDIWRLYSVAQRRHLPSELRVQVPSDKIPCGSSRGWLFCLGTKDLDITLFNPFTRAQISLPPIDNEERQPIVEKAILSADPSLYPNDYIVAACTVNAESRYVLALIRPGRENGRWRTLTLPDRWKDYNHCDIIFDRSVKWVYAAMRHNGSVVRAEIEGGVFEKMADPSMHEDVRYLGQMSSGGDLLMFTGIYGDKVQVWKLQGSSFVGVDNLAGDTAVFIGPDHSSTTLIVRGFPGVETDCVYYHGPGSYDIKEFNLKEGKFKCRFIVATRPTYEDLDRPQPIWILPGVNL